MYLHYGTIQRYHFNPYADEPLLLYGREDPVQHTILCPAIHTQIDRMPLAESLRQAPPFTTMLHNVQNRCQHSPIVYLDVLPLTRKQVLELFVLR